MHCANYGAPRQAGASIHSSQAYARLHVRLAAFCHAGPDLGAKCRQFSRRPDEIQNTKLRFSNANSAQVHASALVIDTHADTPQRFLDEHFDLGDPLNGGNLNLETARKGNLGAEFFSIWVEPNQYKGQYAHRTLELIDAVKQQVAKHPDQMMLATSPAGN